MRASTSLATFIVTGLVVGGAACGSSGSPQASGTTTQGTGGKGTGGKGTGGTGATGTGGGTVVDGGPVGKFPFPVVSYQGGPIVAAPKIVTVTFPGDSLATQVATFGASVASSSYWDTIRAGDCGNGVCIGDGPPGTAVALTTAPAAKYTDSSFGGPATLKTFVSGLITANTVPMPDANTIYALYFPTTTTITLDGAKSCQDFDGYHDSVMIGSQEVFYAVIPECVAPQMTPAITTLQNTTITAAHELIETASDGSESAFSFYLDLDNPDTYGWDDIQGGELADLCVDPFGLALDETTEGAFTVQRIWSIANAAAGKNPCVPIPAGEVYFNAFPTVSVIVLDVGKSKTIEVDALADGPMGAWTVTPQDWTDYQTQYLGFSVQGGTDTDAGPEIQVKSGDKIQVTVTLVADPITSQYGEADGVIVSANGDPATATAAHFWPFIVLTTAEAADAGISMMKHRAAHARKLAHQRGRRRLEGATR